MRKSIIILGDKTSHGGTVIRASGVATVNGKPIALINDLVECPKCKGTYPIIEGTTMITYLGQAVAVEEMKTACGATLIGSQQIAVIDDDPISARTTSVVSNEDSTTKTALFSNKTDKYQLCFQAIDDNGNPYANIPFSLLLSDGSQVRGKTDEEGFTQVFYSDEEQQATFRLHIDTKEINNWEW